MSPQPSSADPRDKLYIAQVSSLHQSGLALALGAAVAAGGILLSFVHSGSTAFLYLALVFIVTIAARLYAVAKFPQDLEQISTAQAQRWEQCYVLGAAASVGLLGIWCYLAFAADATPFVQMISFTITMAYLIGVFGRNFANTASVRWQILCVSVPMLAGLLQYGDWLHVAFAALLVPIFVAIGLLASRMGKLMRDAYQLKADAETSRRRLWDAIEALPEGFVIYDADDRFVLCNEPYKQLNAGSREFLVTGATFEALMRNEVRLGERPEALGREEQWLAERLQNHRACNQSFESKRANGRIYRIHEKRTSNGDIVGFRIDITELKHAQQQLQQANAELERTARNDFLTGLANRRSLAHHLERVSRQQHGQIAAVYVDIDRFKEINDTLGHDAGDCVLKQLADRLKANVPAKHLIARAGGDEFVIVLAEETSESATQFATELRDNIAGDYPYNNTTVQVDISVGVAILDASAKNPEQCLIDADIALYEAKQQGRGRVVMFAPRMQAQLIEQRLLAEDLRYGIDHDGFYPVYQPRFDIHTLRIKSAEALVRWTDKSGSMHTPAHFMALATQLGIIADIDRLMLSKAIDDQDAWPTPGGRQVGLSVNVSPNRLNDPGLLRELKHLELKNRRLSFELVETIWFDGLPQNVRQSLQRIRQMGIDVELDDFGAGHASLSGLLAIGAQTVKIDRQLVSPITHDAKSFHLLRSLVTMLIDLDLRVVAEGVETFEQYALLRDIGCHEVQGFGLAKPMPQAELIDWIAGKRSPPNWQWQRAAI